MATGISGQPFFTSVSTTFDDGLFANGPVKTRNVVLEQDADADDDLYVRGRLLNLDADGKYHAISSTESTIAIAATTGAEIGADNADGTATSFTFTLAHPPVPRTLRVVTTANASATVVKDAGTDNGFGAGVGADGSFVVNYQTGAVTVTFATAPTATHDVKVAYKYRAVDAPDTGETLTGQPMVILGEDIPAARINEGDVTTFAYDSGEFNAAKLHGYSAGFKEGLRQGGIYVRP